MDNNEVPPPNGEYLADEVAILDNSANGDAPVLKLSSCSKEQLLEMLALLEAELQARDVMVATLQVCLSFSNCIQFIFSNLFRMRNCGT